MTSRKSLPRMWACMICEQAITSLGTDQCKSSKLLFSLSISLNSKQRSVPLILNDQMALQILDYPSSPSLKEFRSRLSYQNRNFMEPERDGPYSYRCSRNDKEIRPTVIIHYMPHRTFETPILCTCVPAVEPDLLSTATSQAANLLTSAMSPYSKSVNNLSDNRRNVIRETESSAASINFKRVRQQPRKSAQGTFDVAGLLIDSDKPFLKSATRPMKPSTSRWTLNITRGKSSTFKRLMMKPYRQLKGKLTRKTLNVQKTLQMNEPYCRYFSSEH